MRLIDADNFKQIVMVTSIAEECDAGFTNELCELIDSQPTAYDVDKVCRKINENKEADNLIDADHAIKIVKEGATMKSLKKCEYRHENGNCLVIGGFCTSIPQNYCNMAKRLRKYEELGLTPEQLRKIDDMYADRCKEISELKKG